MEGWNVKPSIDEGDRNTPFTEVQLTVPVFSTFTFTWYEWQDIIVFGMSFDTNFESYGNPGVVIAGGN